MANTRPIPRLDKLAFEAFLRYRKEYNKEEYKAAFQDPVIMQHMVIFFLQCIADAGPVGVAEKLLKKNPLLAIASGTVTTVSGYTYENISAVQLAYLMDDVEMCTMMLSFIKKLPPEMIEKAYDQLAKKMAEVEKQRADFKPYDFSKIVKAITEDQQLKNTERPSSATEIVLANFKEDFKAGIIKEGKSWINEHLQEGFRIYDENRDPWDENQLRWYLINIIGHMETLAEKCFEQECSQGLKEIMDEKKPNRRINTIENYINDLPLTYRGSPDSSLLLGRDFFVRIDYGWGCAGRSGWQLVGRCNTRAIEIYVEQKDQAWKNLSSSLTSSNHHTNSNRY